jgi:hypothetical protein
MTSRFDPPRREISMADETLRRAIAETGKQLESLIERIPSNRHRALALTALEDMWFRVDLALRTAP